MRVAACHITQTCDANARRGAGIGMFLHIAGDGQRDAAQVGAVAAGGVFLAGKTCKPCPVAQAFCAASHLFQSLDLERQARDPIRGLPSFLRGPARPGRSARRSQARLSAPLHLSSSARKAPAGADRTALRLATIFRPVAVGSTTTQMIPRSGLSRGRCIAFRPKTDRGSTRAQGTANV